MSKADTGNFFEDFHVGRDLVHPTPRTVTEGDRALYTALYPTRFALYASDAFARAAGLARAPIEDLAAFHVVFGKSVPQVSLNAVANLGYAEGRFHGPVFPGETLSSTSKVIGVRENSNGKTGVVWVHTVGRADDDRTVIDFKRWVMVRKRDSASPAPDPVVPQLADAVEAADLILPDGLDFRGYDADLAGSPHLWGDYAIGEKIDHVDGVTLEEAEHMMATRLWQNTAKVHFSTLARPNGRLIYGGHIISLARALSFNGLANAQIIVGVNGGAHTAPSMAGDTIHAWSEVLDKAETAKSSVGALRLRLVAVKNRPAAGFPLHGGDGKPEDGVVLDLDYWALMPKA